MITAITRHYRRRTVLLSAPLLATLVVLATLILLAALAVLATGLPAAGPALADAQLCGGASYASCINAGYTDHGYGENDISLRSYWGMTPGHNCTNYAAYAEQVVNGVTAPSYSLGDAYQWGTIAAEEGARVDSTPAAGSVAWWKENVGNAGSAGHVAYVEAVNGDGSITISEDSYPNSYYPSGWFDWQTITPGSPDWPSGFIRFS